MLNLSDWRSLCPSLIRKPSRPSRRRRGFVPGPAIELLEKKTLLAVDLTLASSDGDVAAEAGESIVYTYEYANAGDTNAANVVLRARVPRHTSFDAAASDPRWSCEESRCTLELPGVAAGAASESVALGVTVDADLSDRVRRVTAFGRISDDGSQGRDAQFVTVTSTDQQGCTRAFDVRPMPAGDIPQEWYV